jgi:hypothetical protein
VVTGEPSGRGERGVTLATLARGGGGPEELTGVNFDEFAPRATMWHVQLLPCRGSFSSLCAR